MPTLRPPFMPIGKFVRFTAVWVGAVALAFALALAQALIATAACAADIEPVRIFPATEMSGPVLPANAVLLMRASPGARADTDVLRIGVADSGYPPLEIITTGAQVAGITADYATLVAKRLKKRVEVVTAVNFVEALNLLKLGEIDLVGSVSRTPERETYATFSRPYLSSQPVVIQRRDMEKRDEVQLGTVIAVDKGSAVVEFIKHDFPSGKLVELASPLAALQLVARGQADSYVGELITAAYLIETRCLSSLRTRSAAGFAAGELGFAVSKTQPLAAGQQQRAGAIGFVKVKAKIAGCRHFVCRKVGIARLPGRRADTAIGILVCRGNSRSGWLAEGGYGRIAEAVLGGLKVDHFLLEYDDERSGDFAPLRHVPRGVRVVLGLVTTKRCQLESADDLMRRIDAASRLVPLHDLGLSPQCGFASQQGGGQHHHNCRSVAQTGAGGGGVG